MVHQTSSPMVRPYAVIGIMFNEGPENMFLKKLIENGYVEWNDLFGSYKLDQVLYYEGGLTTPGCSEVVHWNIWPKVQYASKEQIEYLAGVIDLTGAKRDYYPTVYHETYRN